LPLAEAGDSYAQLVVAMVYLKSPEGLSTGLYWCNKAASQDNFLAQKIIQHLQGVFGNNLGSTPQNTLGALASALAPAR